MCAPVQSDDVVQTLDRALADIAQSRAYNEWLFDRIGSGLGPRVVDVGAGVGTFAELAARAGATVTAVEPEPQFAAYLRERFARSDAVSVVEATVDALPASAFDSAICFNVLEHIADDVGALQAIRRALAPRGRLFLLVPAHQFLYGGYDRAAGHVRRYSKTSLRRSLTSAGFELERLRYVNPVGALGWLARVRFAARGEWPSRSFAAFDRLVPLLRWLDAVPMPFGLSLWAVAVRPSVSATEAENADEQRE